MYKLFGNITKIYWKALCCTCVSIFQKKKLVNTNAGVVAL